MTLKVTKIISKHAVHDLFYNTRDIDAHTGLQNMIIDDNLFTITSYWMYKKVKINYTRYAVKFGCTK